jgi:hypothetical protein
MNDQNSTLRRAMAAVDEDPTIGALAAISSALAVQEEPEHPRDDPVRAKQLQEAAEQRQRDADAALADAIETVARHRARLGRRTCTAQDGSVVRRVFELLRGLTPGTEE